MVDSKPSAVSSPDLAPWKDDGMPRYRKLVAVLAIVLGSVTTVLPAKPNASDFDTTFTVVVFGHDTDCWMRLTAGTKTYDVRWHWRNEFRSPCPEHFHGEELQGKTPSSPWLRKIQFLRIDSKGKPKVEEWYITTQTQ